MKKRSIIWLLLLASIILLKVNPYDIFNSAFQFIKANMVLSLLAFLNLVGGILRFYFGIDNFKTLVQKSKAEASYISDNFIAPLFSLVIGAIKYLFKNTVFFFFKSPYRYWARVPVYLALFAIVLIQYKNYRYNKNRYQICILYDSYAETQGLPALITETIHSALDSSDIRYRYEKVKAGSGINLAKYDLVLSVIVQLDIVVPLYSSLKKNVTICFDLLNARHASVIKQYVSKANMYFPVLFPPDSEKLELVSSYLKNTKALLISEENRYTRNELIIPANISIASSRNNFLPETESKKFDYLILSEQKDEITLLVNGLQKKKVILMNPYKYYNTDHDRLENMLRIVPFADLTTIEKFNSMATKEGNDYFTLLRLYMKDFLGFLFSELKQKEAKAFSVNDLKQKEFTGYTGKIKLNDSLWNVYGNYYLYDAKTKKVLRRLYSGI